MTTPARWQPADDAEGLPFARALTRRTMMPYYTRYELLWRDEDYDAGWSWRENYLLMGPDGPLGYISLTQDPRALYIREFHLIDTARRQGQGTAALKEAFELAARRGLSAVRLTVFKGNPAQRLYERQGFAVVGEDGCFWRMERNVETTVSGDRIGTRTAWRAG